MPYWLIDPLVLLGSSGPLDITSDDRVVQLNSLMILTIILTIIIMVMGGKWALFFLISTAINIFLYLYYCWTYDEEYLTRDSIGLREHKISYPPTTKFVRKRA